MTDEESADNPCADALDRLWNEIIIARLPDYGDWEYPGMAYRHLKCEFEDNIKRILAFEEAAREVLDSIRDYPGARISAITSRKLAKLQSLLTAARAASPKP